MKVILQKTLKYNKIYFDKKNQRIKKYKHNAELAFPNFYN